MKKLKLILVGISILSTTMAFAQWTTSGSNIYNTSSGFVGIGTGATISEKLHVKDGSIRIDKSNGVLRFVDGATTKLIVGPFSGSQNYFRSENMPAYITTSGASNHLYFGTTNLSTPTTRLQIYDDGKVYVGNPFAAPTQKLTVQGAIEIGSTATHSAGTLRYNSGSMQFSNGTNWNNLASVWTQVGSNAQFLTGKVYIGSNAGGSTLNVNGSAPSVARFSSTGADAYMQFYTNGTSYAGYAGAFTNANDMDFGSVSGKTHLVTASNPRLTVTQSGDVGIGTTSPLHKLHVVGDVAVSGQIVHPSDRNLKENIQSIDNGLSLINQLNPATYNYKAKAAANHGLSTNQQYGLIAQEVQKVLPAIVKENTLQDEDGTSYLGMDYEKLIPILVQAVKELSTENEALKLENQDQKKNIEKILTELNLNNTSSK